MYLVGEYILRNEIRFNGNTTQTKLVLQLTRCSGQKMLWFTWQIIAPSHEDSKMSFTSFEKKQT